MIRSSLLLFFLIFSFQNIKAQFVENADSAFALAMKRDNPVMLIFSGSDWCTQCMRLEKKILNTPEFVHFSDSGLIVLEADFPQSRKLSAEKIRQNEALAEKYNPSGSIPFIVLLRPDKKVVAYLKYQNESLGDFIGLIKSSLP